MNKKKTKKQQYQEGDNRVTLLAYLILIFSFVGAFVHWLISKLIVYFL